MFNGYNMMGGWFSWWFYDAYFWVVAIFLLVWLIRELFW